LLAEAPMMRTTSFSVEFWHIRRREKMPEVFDYVI